MDKLKSVTFNDLDAIEIGAAIALFKKQLRFGAGVFYGRKHIFDHPPAPRPTSQKNPSERDIMSR